MRGRGGERQFHSVSGSLDALLPSEGDILVHVNYQPWKNLKESSYFQVEKTNWIVPSLRCCRKDVRALGPRKPELPCCKEGKGGFHKPIFGSALFVGYLTRHKIPTMESMSGIYWLLLHSTHNLTSVRRGSPLRYIWSTLFFSILLH